MDLHNCGERARTVTATAYGFRGKRALCIFVSQGLWACVSFVFSSFLYRHWWKALSVAVAWSRGLFGTSCTSLIMGEIFCECWLKVLGIMVQELRTPFQVWTRPQSSGLTADELHSKDHYGFSGKLSRDLWQCIRQLELIRIGPSGSGLVEFILTWCTSSLFLFCSYECVGLFSWPDGIITFLDGVWGFEQLFVLQHG